MKHGKGLYKFSDGSTIDGQFINDKPAEGVFKTKKGQTEYHGSFKNSQWHGKGKLIFEGGKIYQGEFKAGKFSGVGVLKTPDGEVYEGGFNEGKKHGVGTTYKIGKEDKKKKGEWKKGKRVKWIKI